MSIQYYLCKTRHTTVQRFLPDLSGIYCLPCFVRLDTPLCSGSYRSFRDVTDHCVAVLTRPFRDLLLSLLCKTRHAIVQQFLPDPSGIYCLPSFVRQDTPLCSSSYPIFQRSIAFPALLDKTHHCIAVLTQSFRELLPSLLCKTRHTTVQRFLPDLSGIYCLPCFVRQDTPLCSGSYPIFQGPYQVVVLLILLCLLLKQ